MVTSDDTAGRPVSLARWSRLAQDIAGEHGVYVARCRSWLGSRAARRFPVGRFWRGHGEISWYQGPVFQEAIIPAVIDFEEITRARADLPLLADLEMRLPHLLGVAACCAAGEGKRGSGEASRDKSLPQAKDRAVARGGEPASSPPRVAPRHCSSARRPL